LNREDVEEHTRFVEASFGFCRSESLFCRSNLTDFDAVLCLAGAKRGQVGQFCFYRASTKSGLVETEKPQESTILSGFLVILIIFYSFL